MKWFKWFEGSSSKVFSWGRAMVRPFDELGRKGQATLAMGLFFVTCWSQGASSTARQIHLKWGDVYPAPRWEPGDGKLSPSDLSFKKVKVSLSRGDFQQCLKEVEGASQSYPSLIPWVFVYRLRCAEGLAQSKGGDEAPLSLALVEVSQKPSWLLKGPYRKSLRQAFLSGLITELSKRVERLKESSKRSRKDSQEKSLDENLRVWQGVDELESYSHWLNQRQRAKVWQRAGELALLEKKLSLSMDFMERSLTHRESKEVRHQWKRLQSQLFKGKKPAGESRKRPSSREKSKHPSTVTKRESQLLRQVRKSKNMVGVIRAGVELIAQYPLGKSAKEAEKKVGGTLVRLLKKGPRGHAYNQALELVLGSDGQSLYHWSKRAYRAELYGLAYRLARQSYDKKGEWPSRTPEILQLLGRSAFHANKWAEAAQFWGLLIEKYAASEETEEAMMRLGDASL